MVVSLDQRVQRPHWYAIVDEVDSVLIDEARTPLIISGPVGDESELQYREYNATVARVVRAQSDDANRLVAEARGGHGERATRTTAALRFYQAQLGAPKNKRLLKALQEPGVKQLVQQMELDHIADRKQPAAKQQFRDIEERLLFVLDETRPHRAPHRSRRGSHVAGRSRCVRPARTSRKRCIASITTPALRRRRSSTRARRIEREYARRARS